jgi:hypothetical protein
MAKAALLVLIISGQAVEEAVVILEVQAAGEAVQATVVEADLRI